MASLSSISNNVKIFSKGEMAGLSLSLPSKLTQKPTHASAVCRSSSSSATRCCISSVKLTVSVDEKKKNYTLKKSEEAFNAAKDQQVVDTFKEITNTSYLGRALIISLGAVHNKPSSPARCIMDSRPNRSFRQPTMPLYYLARLSSGPEAIQQAFSPAPPGSGYPAASPGAPAYSQQPLAAYGSSATPQLGLAGFIYGSAQPFFGGHATGSFQHQQPTDLASVFSQMSVQPTHQDPHYYMDSGAISHMTFNQGS